MVSLSRLGFWILWAMPLLSLANVYSLVTVSGLSIKATDVLFLIGCLVCVVLILRSQRVTRAAVPYITLLGVYVTGVLAGSLFVKDYDISWPIYMRFLVTILWGGLAVIILKTEQDLQRITLSVALAGAVLALFSLYYFITVPDVHRIAGFFAFAGGDGLGRQASYNEIGAIHALACLLLFDRLRTQGRVEQSEQKAWTLFLMISNAAGLVLTQSRSALMATAIGLGYAVLVRRSPRKLLSITVITVVLSGALLLVQGLGVNRLSESIRPGMNAYDSMQYRFHMWERSLNLWLGQFGSFLLGYGNMGFRDRLGSATSDMFYLDRGLSEGVIGLLALLMLAYWPFRYLKKSGGGEKPGISAFLVALVVSMTGNVLVDPFYGGITFMVLYGSLATHYRQLANPRGGTATPNSLGGVT